MLDVVECATDEAAVDTYSSHEIGSWEKFLGYRVREMKERGVY